MRTTEFIPYSRSTEFIPCRIRNEFCGTIRNEFRATPPTTRRQYIAPLRHQ